MDNSLDNYQNYSDYDNYISDMAEEGVSNCCGAEVVMDICMDCYEGCSIEKEE